LGAALIEIQSIIRHYVTMIEAMPSRASCDDGISATPARISVSGREKGLVGVDNQAERDVAIAIG
jgi:hypothetical protein